MKSRILKMAALATVVVAFAVSAFALAPAPIASASDFVRGGPGGRPGGSVGGRAAVTRPYVGSTTALTPAEVQLLNQAVLEEYLALNTYKAAINQFGSVVPFSRIAQSEAQHVAALSQVLTRHKLAAPANPGLSPAPTWTSFANACQTGVDVEKEDAKLYDDLLAKTTNPELQRVFTTLRAASLNNHLPAFEACN